MIENNKLNKMDKFNNFLQKSLNSQRRAQTKAEVNENPFNIATSDNQGDMSWQLSPKGEMSRNGYQTSVIIN